MRNHLLAVLLVLPILGCGYTPSPEVAETRKIMKEIVGALDAFKKDQKRYPQALADLMTKPKYLDPKTSKWPANGYIKAIPRDAWGQEITYKIPGSFSHPFDLISLGEDGKAGGKNDAQDVWHFPPPAPKK